MLSLHCIEMASHPAVVPVSLTLAVIAPTDTAELKGSIPVGKYHHLMVRTAEKVRSLCSEDEEMEAALETILEAADESDALQWEDVESDITSGHWGRMIEKGILQSVEDGAGFTVKEPDVIEDILSGEDIDTDLDLEIPDLDIDPDESSWTQWDKAAGGLTLAMMVGYYFDPVQNIVGGAVDLFLGPLNAVLPFFAVILAASLLTGLYSTLLQANLMDMERMGAYRERMQAVQEKRKKAKEAGDDEAMEYIQEKQMEMMGDQLSMFKEQFRPMVWIMLLTIPIFLWIWWMASHPEMAIGREGYDIVFPIAGGIEDWNEGLIGPLRAWIVWYIVCSIGFTQVMRKSLNISPMPGT